MRIARKITEIFSLTCAFGTLTYLNGSWDARQTGTSARTPATNLSPSQPHRLFSDAKPVAKQPARQSLNLSPTRPQRANHLSGADPERG